MVSTLSRVFTTISSGARMSSPSNMPMINSLTNSTMTFVNSANQIRRKKGLMAWFKTQPELTAFVIKVAKDIVSDYHFEPVSPNESGRNKVMRANKFGQQVKLQGIMLSQAIDMLGLGEGFGWIGKLHDDDLKDAVDSVVKRRFGKESKNVSKRLMLEVKHTEGFADLAHIDEDIIRPRKYQYVPSSTVEIRHDQFTIIDYVQVIGVNRVVFQPEDLIRFTLMNVDGKISGFTPVDAALVQLELLRQMWQNNLSLHKNGGHPDKIISLENTKPNDAAYKRIEEQLQKYKLVENKHGMMLFTGKLQIEDLQQLDQMQFKDMGLYVIGVLAMLWGIPKSSIPMIIGGTNTKSDTGGSGEKDYWKNVMLAQRLYAETMNTQLWIPHFGVKIVFDRAFIQQDLQEQTAEQLKLNNLMTKNTLLASVGQQLSKTKLLREIGYTVSDIEDKPEDLMIDERGSAFGMENQLSDNEKTDGDDKANLRAKKAEEQRASARSRGVVPSGR